ncbi:PPOX class F420-dependent oxidoreductase [Georgenia yuyongxinii]|uniref:PPOX class F420-dependent oxidoreductase n=1 Tax=Georgenia yuyongxinii TaxID=2589797 RepID=A0A5B8C3I9_9MICO|nr:PPOX class F420-dependent oxidoreductase [Georgenia yuyongxinii]QDC25173.1 PPOX class F420-dependent oxidoreductase [Georgenia yuyongxinii]
MFREDEVAYLRSQPFGRIATMGVDDQPDVVPVALEFDGTFFWVGGVGGSVLTTRKFRNVAAGRTNVAIIVDDMVSFDPFVARSIRVYGVADGPVERVGMVGPGVFLRVTPTVSWSWNMAGEPVGETWYAATRREHEAPPSGAD